MKPLALAGKTALVTGGAQGIGRAICERYAAEGARVVIADINSKEALRVARGIGGDCRAVELDVASMDSIRAMTAQVSSEIGYVDVLVNNAGVFDMSPILETTEESFDRIFSVNVKGLFFTLQSIAALMVKNRRSGKIINLASEAGRRGEAMVAAYCASKAAVISITQSVALELIRTGIHVNAISPGVVDTPMWGTVDALFARYEGRLIGEKKRIVGEAVPFGRMGLPSDLAGAAVFLASSDSDYIVGQTLNVDGGAVLS
jgi:NAD(P)-dependent dehydrogenase (short-subunit alcohol dehydrogenase family)